GGPDHATPEGESNGVALMLPESLISPQDSAFLLPALEAQGYLKKNITFSTTAGGYSNDAYYAIADQTPAINRFGFMADAGDAPGLAGAVNELDYAPKGNDPTGDAVHWIQVIHTNVPTGFGVTNGVNLGGGFYAYIDDEDNPPGNPNYDGL